MKQILLILTLMAIGSVGVILFHQFSPHTSLFVTQQIPLHSVTPSSSITTSSVGIPMTLQIPVLGVTSTVEKVGLDSENRMDVPKTPDDVGWYDLGYKPGEKGNAVIDGHYDKIDGSPAVFYKVSSLKTGDDLIVNDELGASYDFKVSKVVTYPYDNLPLQDIFAGHSSSQLILITCSGTWDRGTQNYSTRTVVYSEL